MTAVSARGLRISYDGTEILHGVDVDVVEGSVLALLGPSGCGKTTLLRSIAGLERVDGGTIEIGDRRVADGDGTHVPPERRQVGMVFQDWALFPHLTVAGNVGYGLPRGERKGGPRVEAALELVGLDGLGDRMPSTLSGGQQQRVALARAIAPEPAVLLLDEPFSNLDTALRSRVRSEVHELLTRLAITTIFVTHDQDEAFVLGDAVAIMSAGRIVQMGPPHEIYAAPANEWVARFVGDANFLAGTVSGRLVDTPIGRLSLADDASGAVEVLVRPEDLQVDVGAAGPGTVRSVEYYGRETVYVVEIDEVPDGAATTFDAPDHAVRVRARESGPPRCAVGDRVGLLVQSDDLLAFPAHDRRPT